MGLAGLLAPQHVLDRKYSLYIRMLRGFSHTISRAYAGVAVACAPGMLCTTMAIWPGSVGRVLPSPPETWILMLLTPLRADNNDCTFCLLLPAINLARLSFCASLNWKTHRPSALTVNLTVPVLASARAVCVRA